MSPFDTLFQDITLTSFVDLESALIMEIKNITPVSQILSG